MSGRTAAQVAGITALTAVTGLLGYAIYFDYQRRNNPDFRKGIKKQHKQIRAAAEARSKAEKEKNTKAIREAVREIQMEMPPLTPEAQEAFFQEQVAEGEKLATLGPSEHVNSAKAFYRALRVYPQPVELLTIYQKVVPEPIFELVLEIVRLSPGGPGAGGPSAGGPIPPPSQPFASVSDIDEGSGSGSGVGSGNEWERVSEGN